MRFRLREGRELSVYGGYGIDRHLHRMQSTPAVFWSKGSNSFVVTQEEDGTFRVHSINGIGETRWTLDPQNNPVDSWAEGAIEYFLEEAE